MQQLSSAGRHPPSRGSGLVFPAPRPSSGGSQEAGPLQLPSPSLVRKPSAPRTAPPYLARQRHRGTLQLPPKAIEAGPAQAHTLPKGSHKYLHPHVNIMYQECLSHARAAPARGCPHTNASTCSQHALRPATTQHLHLHRVGFALPCPPGQPHAVCPKLAAQDQVHEGTSLRSRGSAQSAPGPPWPPRPHTRTPKPRTHALGDRPRSPAPLLLAGPWGPRRVSPRSHPLPAPERWPLGAAAQATAAPPGPAARTPTSPRPLTSSGSRPARPP